MEQVEGQVFLIAGEAAHTPDQSAAAPGSTEQAADEVGPNPTKEQLLALNETISKQLEKLQTVLANIPGIVYAIDRLGIITLLDGKGIDSLDGSAREAFIFDLYCGNPETLSNWRRALSGEAFTALHEVGECVLESRFMPIRDHNDEVTSIICILIDVTERSSLEKKRLAAEALLLAEHRRAEEALRYQALHDSLTDLPNRTLLQERLEHALHYAEQHGLGAALLILDIDRFKDINDTFGYQHGDVLLQETAIRLRRTVSDAATIARLGGDEFAILLPIADIASMDSTAQELHKALEEPFCVAGNPLQIEASIGGVLYPVHGTDPLTLMRRADVAIYNAKHMHERYMLYDATHDDQGSSRRIALFGALRNAIAADELMLYYQPKVDLKTGTASSTEALARWQHPTYGFVPPDQFISLAEQTGLITPLTHWALATAIKQCSAWLRNGLDLNIAVNLSMWNLRDAALPEIIAQLLEQHNVPPRFLRVELTESAVMTDADRALDVLTRLSAFGVRISIDDFGTGYSSLAYLKRLPVDELKIDRSFVQHMSKVEADATIVRSMVTLAHGLGLQVVAEGVEDQATWQILDALDCDIAQGYYMSRPLPARSFEDWLRNAQPRTKTVTAQER